MTVHRITVQRGGHITEGFYVVDDGTLIMTGPGGNPVDKTRFRRALTGTENPDAIAAVLTHEIRREILGITETEEAFGRTINYLPSGQA